MKKERKVQESRKRVSWSKRSNYKSSSGFG